MTITEFLEARIAEDEESNNPKPDPSGSCDYLHGVHYESARVLAECAAKRAIIGLAKRAAETERDYDDFEWQGTVERSEPLTGDAILFALAAVYADHADYRQEWAL